MSIEPIGVATLLIGIMCMLLGNNATIIVAAVGSLFGAAAAVLLGGTNIQPGHVLLGFLALGVMTRDQASRAFVDALKPGRAGFWFALLVFYGVLSAYFTPRLLSGITSIVPLGSTIYGDTGPVVPLVPVSTNLTQSVYMVGNLVCFAMAVSVASTEAGFSALLTGMLAFSILNVFFALLDIATFSTGTQGFLSFMRNAQYTLHIDDQVAGVKRIVGSFTESSSFARTTLGTFAFSATLWLCGRRSAMNGVIALASFVLVVLSTSSTGLAGAPVMLVVLYITALTVSGRKTLRSSTAAAIVFMPLLILAAGLYVAIDPDLSKITYDYADVVVLGKTTTDSGIERSLWNQVGLQNFFDTSGFGVGLGTARTSSLILALLATVGIPGTVLYAVFAYTALIKTRGTSGTLASDARLAARNGCLGLMLGDALVAPVIDQGLFFYFLAALAAAEPERAQQTVRISRPLGVTA